LVLKLKVAENNLKKLLTAWFETDYNEQLTENEKRSAFEVIGKT
jgi:hypothetical protein